MSLPVVITEAQPDEKTLAKCLYVRISRRADECGDCLEPHQGAAAYPGIRRLRVDIATAIFHFHHGRQIQTRTSKQQPALRFARTPGSVFRPPSLPLSGHADGSMDSRAVAAVRQSVLGCRHASAPGSTLMPGPMLISGSTPMPGFVSTPGSAICFTWELHDHYARQESTDTVYHRLVTK